MENIDRIVTPAIEPGLFRSLALRLWNLLYDIFGKPVLEMSEEDQIDNRYW